MDVGPLGIKTSTLAHQNNIKAKDHTDSHSALALKKLQV